MKIKVFEMEFDASNLQEVAFVKEVITGSNLSVKTETVAVVQEKEEKPVEAKGNVSGSAPRPPFKPEKKKEAIRVKNPVPVESPVEATEPTEAQKPVETVTNKTEEPTAKEMQDLVIGLIKSGELSREDVQNIIQEFGGTSLMKIAPAKFALLKQRLTTYKND